MNESIPFVEITKSALPVFGKRDAETRVYRREGTAQEVAAWFDKIIEIAGPAVSPGGVCMYAHVSRAAVYKALNEGRLTAFGFHVISESRSVFGFKKKTREMPYVYVPVSEAKAWGKVINAKAEAKTLTTEDNPGGVDNRTYGKLEAGVMEGKYPKKRAKK